MSIDSINAAATSTYGANPSRTNATVNQENTSSSWQGHEVEDIIELSPAAKRFSSGDLTDEQRATFIEHQKRFNESQERLKYAQDRQKFMEEKHGKMSAFHNMLLQESGGLLYGTAFSDNLSKPITTTSGAPHPQADIIRSFLMKHRTELDEMNTLRDTEFMSFKEWKTNRSETV